MRAPLFASLVLSSSILLACGGAEPPPPPPPPPPVAPPPAPVASAAPTDTAPAAPAMTPEEEKKAKAKKELDEDRAKWQDAYNTEVSRWTPDLRAQAAKLAGTTYPSLQAAMKAILPSPVRTPGAANRDKYRHPAETLAFFGIKPNMTVLEVGPGEGWYSEILAPMLASKGKLIDTSGDPNGPEDSRGTFYAQRWAKFLAKSPELFGKVQTIVIDGKAPSLSAIPAGSLDAVLVMREVHGMVNSNTFNAWLTEWRKALKPNGILGIEEHRAKDGADPVESSKQGYVPQQYVIDTVQAAGFKLAGKSEINANPKDTKDYPEGVWALPPTYQRGDKDKGALTAIGESDRMTLKFTKAPDGWTPPKK
jgi:predicted methyltransferase